MKILIVEDTEDKMKEIEKNVLRILDNCSFVEAMSYSDGIKKIYENKWDLILLDMSLPTYNISHAESGGIKKPIAGKEIIKRMHSRNIIVPTIIITQFDVFGEKKISLDSLNKEFEQNYTHIWRGTVSYDKPDWQNALDKLLRRIGEND